jgi:uncharacterized protein (DUF302 family)
MFDSYGRWISERELRRRSSEFVLRAPLFIVALVFAIAMYLFSAHGSAHAKNTHGANMSSNTTNGLVSKKSNHSVDETVAKLESILQAKGVKLFAVVDHSGEAEKAGLSMPPTKLLIFGNPKAGTPLMLASPSAAIDLPLKILVYQDKDGAVWICYNSAEYLAQRHNLPQDLMPSIAVVDALAAKAAE